MGSMASELLVRSRRFWIASSYDFQAPLAPLYAVTKTPPRSFTRCECCPRIGIDIQSPKQMFLHAPAAVTRRQGGWLLYSK